jgi:hypothetical protein
MKALQFTYPFETNPIVVNLAGAKYMQIGIECPHSIPLSEIPINGSNVGYSLSVNINGKDYNVTDKDILEFSDLDRSEVRVLINEPDNPYIIVDIAYEIQV